MNGTYSIYNIHNTTNRRATTTTIPQTIINKTAGDTGIGSMEVNNGKTTTTNNISVCTTIPNNSDTHVYISHTNNNNTNTAYH